MSIYYDNSELLSHNKLFSFVVGSRAGGKSYNAKRWLINDYLKGLKKKNPELRQTVWLRRYQTEYDALPTFFADISQEFPDHEFEIKGNRGYIDGELVIYFLTLSTTTQVRSAAFPHVNKIIFDEFLIDNPNYRYLKNEATVFLSLFDTVARLRDNCRAYFIGNSTSVVNPYFLFFNIKPREGQRFSKTKHTIIEMYTNDQLKDARLETRFGDFIKDTAYGSFSMDNKFVNDDDTFIMKKSPEARNHMNIKYNGTVYGFWYDYPNCKIYVDTKYDPYINIWALTMDDHSENHMLISSIKRFEQFKQVKLAFEKGYLYFDSHSTKTALFQILRLTL